jgi:hypothetical protein
MVDDGAKDGVGMMWILLTIVASTLSGDYPLASSAAVTCARAASVSVSEDMKTTATTDDDTDDAQDCLNEDNLVYVIYSDLLYDLHDWRGPKRDCGRV